MTTLLHDTNKPSSLDTAGRIMRLVADVKRANDEECQSYIRGFDGAIDAIFAQQNACSDKRRAVNGLVEITGLEFSVCQNIALCPNEAQAVHTLMEAAENKLAVAA